MSQLIRLDDVIVDKRGLASITARNMEAFNLKHGDLFFIGIDISDNACESRQILFIKFNGAYNIDEKSCLIRYNKYQLRGCFYLSPILRLLNISPPFICKISDEGSLGNFRLILPEYKSFDLKKINSNGLVPLSEITGGLA